MSDHNFTRRSVMQTSVAAGVTLTTPTILSAASHAGFLNIPTSSNVTLGFNVALTGYYADEGADELRAYKLAVEHLNGKGDGGMLQTFSSKALDGTGILGKKVEYVTGDIQTKPDAARAWARSMIEKHGAIMIAGGSSSGVASSIQALCHQVGIIFMASLVHSNDITGKDKKANGFRHFLNSYMIGAALAPVLADRYGPDRIAYHLTADHDRDNTTEEAVKNSTEALGWETVAAVKTPLSQTDFSSYVAPVLNSGADVLVLNQYGDNMVKSLKSAVEFGLRTARANGKDFEIVVPLFSNLMAKVAGKNVNGIFCANGWHWSLENMAGSRYAGTNAFVKSFGEKYGFPPSQAAHTCYCQTLLYADAVQRGGSFNPCSVVEALEGFEFDGMGNGPTLYRTEDHQCIKDVLVMRGKEKPQNDFDLLELIDIIPAEAVTFDPAIFGGELGSCNTGA